LGGSRKDVAAIVLAAASQVSTNDFKTGLNVEVDGVPWKVGLGSFGAMDEQLWDKRCRVL
jgi:hypothetical protein